MPGADYAPARTGSARTYPEDEGEFYGDVEMVYDPVACSCEQRCEAWDTDAPPAQPAIIDIGNKSTAIQRVVCNEVIELSVISHLVAHSISVPACNGRWQKRFGASIEESRRVARV